MASIPWICEVQMKAWVPKEEKLNIINELKWATKILRKYKAKVDASSTVANEIGY